MSNIEEIERAVSSLSSEELSEFRAWFLEFDAEVWDQQLEEDVPAGRLDHLAEEVLAEYRAGRTRPL
jgi:BioD-like phosphotransacetylase family protein